MGILHCLRLMSVDQLREYAVEWNDLWRRSDVALPTVQAELLATWIEQFHPKGQFHAIVVADQDRWVAAIPMVSCRVARLIPAGGLTTNPWFPCGELLVDATANVELAMDLLLAEAAGLPWPLLWFNDMIPESPRWMALMRACHRAGVAACCHERYRVGRVDINSTWDIYRKNLPKNHRQAMQRAQRRLENEGDVRFEMRSRLPIDDVEPWLTDAFQLEDRSWKGNAGSSVLSTPGMFPFFVRQTEHLAALGQFEAASLRLDDRLLAFVYGFRAKGTYFAHKISYDPEFSAFSPGQLLFHHIFERLHSEGDVRVLDFMGPQTQATTRWRPKTYGVGRLAIAPRGGVGHALMYAYQHGWLALRNRTARAESRKHSGNASPEVDDLPAFEPAGTAG